MSTTPPEGYAPVTVYMPEPQQPPAPGIGDVTGLTDALNQLKTAIDNAGREVGALADRVAALEQDPTPTPEPDPSGPWPGTVVVFSASEGGTGKNAHDALVSLDAALAEQVGTTAPLIAGRHSYSGNRFPATFAESSASRNPDQGWTHSLLNVKCDWQQLASGRLDDHLRGFVASIPQGHTVYLIINHEPENDDNPDGPETWCAGQARAAEVVAELDDPRCHLAVCLMSYTWRAKDRDPQDWNPTPGMTPAALARTIFAPDGYTKADQDAPRMVDVFGPVFDSARAWGFTRFGISEHALNNDAGKSPDEVARIWADDLLPWLDEAGLVYYAGYSSEGPAAGTNARIDTPQERAVIGAWVKKRKYGL